MVALAPIVAPFRTVVLAYCPLRLMALRGLTTFVNTIDGPRKTSSSQVTPLYIDTLFCTFTLLPRTTPGDTTTFCPMLQLLPMLLSPIMWQKCHTLVPSPI